MACQEPHMRMHVTSVACMCVITFHRSHTSSCTGNTQDAPPLCSHVSFMLGFSCALAGHLESHLDDAGQWCHRHLVSKGRLNVPQQLEQPQSCKRADDQLQHKHCSSSSSKEGSAAAAAVQAKGSLSLALPLGAGMSTSGRQECATLCSSAAEPPAPGVPKVTAVI